MSVPPPLTQTAASPVLSYSGPQVGVCPLCAQRPLSQKRIYDHPVCKKCFYKFANRRQLGFLVDSILEALIAYPIGFGVGYYLTNQGMNENTIELAGMGVGAMMAVAFGFKDGFSGHSPGKWLSNIQVVDITTNVPIAFGQSFKRNAIFLFGLIPLAGPIASLVIVIALAIMCGNGYRWGDRFANTRAIWKRYAYSPVFGANGNLCTRCGYDLQGNVSGICPECGAPKLTHT